MVIKMNGEFKPGTTVKQDDFIVIASDSVGYTIDFAEDDDTEGMSYEAIVVWDDMELRDRIIELLNKYGVNRER